MKWIVEWHKTNWSPQSDQLVMCDKIYKGFIMNYLIKNKSTPIFNRNSVKFYNVKIMLAIKTDKKLRR